MTDYNDGKWHGWNGGECPVHPESEIEAVWAFDGDSRVFTANASEIAWKCDYNQAIIAFRVITAMEFENV